MGRIEDFNIQNSTDYYSLQVGQKGNNTEITTENKLNIVNPEVKAKYSPLQKTGLVILGMAAIGVGIPLLTLALPGAIIGGVLARAWNDENRNTELYKVLDQTDEGKVVAEKLRKKSQEVFDKIYEKTNKLTKLNDEPLMKTEVTLTSGKNEVITKKKLTEEKEKLEKEIKAHEDEYDKMFADMNTKYRPNAKAEENANILKGALTGAFLPFVLAGCAFKAVGEKQT